MGSSLRELFVAIDCFTHVLYLSCFSGLIPLHGPNHKLSHLYLHSNCISSIDHVLHSMMGLHSLVHLTLEQDGKGNPVCYTEGNFSLIGYSGKEDPSLLVLCTGAVSLRCTVSIKPIEGKCHYWGPYTRAISRPNVQFGGIRHRFHSSIWVLTTGTLPVACPPGRPSAHW